MPDALMPHAAPLPSSAQGSNLLASEALKGQPEGQQLEQQANYQALAQEVKDLRLQLETTIQHSDAIEAELYQRNLELDNARLEAENANELKGKFLSTVTHELRTPLTSMMGFAKLIERDIHNYLAPHIPNDDPPSQNVLKRVLEDIHIIRSEGDRLMSLINDVLNMSKIEAGAVTWNMEAIALDNVLHKAVQSTLGLFNEQRHLRVYIDEDIPQVNGDSSKLLRVIINLISNAVKFSKTDVLCRLETTLDKTEQRWVCLEVEDFGIGIAPENQQRIFEKFQQIETAHPFIPQSPTGTGLGLAICREIIDYHQGRLELRSTLGEGSCFSFCLPALST